MLAGMNRLGITIAVTALVCVIAPGSAGAAKRPRPTDLGPGQAVTVPVPNAIQVFNDYATPSFRYASQRAVVHYVVLGIDAPPLNDDDDDAVPDYVERVADAADTAITYYERRGFAPILADSGGPDSRPDIYVSRFAPGSFGVAFPAADAQGGAFVAVSNALDPSSARSLGSVYGTVAHELFHLVQFSYFPPAAEPSIPAWALEGMAAAMERRVYADLDDIVSSLQMRRWLDAPQRSMTAQSYGSQALWWFLDTREPRLVPAYLAFVARSPARDAAAALVSIYERVARRSFASAFARFAAWAAGQYGDRLTPIGRLRPRDQAAGSVAPLAIHYLRLARRTRLVSIRFTRGRGRVAVTYEFASEVAGNPAVSRRLDGRVLHGGRQLVYRIPAPLRRNGRFESPTLVVANGDAARPVAYQIATS